MNRPTRKFSFKSLLTSIVEIILCKLILFYRRMSKYLVHLVTGKSELERICADQKCVSIRIKKIGIYARSMSHYFVLEKKFFKGNLIFYCIEKSLRQSSNVAIKEIVAKFNSYAGNEEEIVFCIMKIKNIPQDSVK